MVEESGSRVQADVEGIENIKKITIHIIFTNSL